MEALSGVVPATFAGMRTVSADGLGTAIGSVVCVAIALIWFAFIAVVAVGSNRARVRQRGRWSSGGDGGWAGWLGSGDSGGGAHHGGGHHGCGGGGHRCGGGGGGCSGGGGGCGGGGS